MPNRRLPELIHRWKLHICQRGSLIYHLEDTHRQKIKSVQRWCSFCQASVPRNIAQHSCFQITNYYEKSNSLKFKCRRCNFSCPSSAGIVNHFRKHKRSDIIEYRNNINLQTQSSSNILPNNSETNLQTNSSPSPNPTPSAESNVGDSQLSATTAGASQNSQLNDNMFNIENDTGLHDADEEFFQNTRLPHPDAPSPSWEFILLLNELARNFNENKWEEFEELLKKFIDFGQEFVHLKKFKKISQRAKPNSKINSKDPSNIQKLYRRNRRRATREILHGSSSSCNVPAEDLREQFFNDEQAPFDESIFTPGTTPPEYVPFTAAEVCNKLKKCEKTAPDQDRLTYNH